MTFRLLSLPTGSCAGALVFACSPTSGTSDTAVDSDSASGGKSGGDGDLIVGDGDLGLGDGDFLATGGTSGGVPTGRATAVPGAYLGAPPAGCSPILPVTFRDFRASGETGGHQDFELSEIYTAGGSNWPSGEYGEGNLKGNAAYKGLNEAGCGLIATTLDTNSKPSFASGLGQKRELSPQRNEGNNPPVLQGVTGCVPWDWGWTPPNVIANTTSFSTWYNTVEGTNMEIPGYLELTNGAFESSDFFPLDNEGFGNTPGQTHNYHFTTEAHVTFAYEGGKTFSFQGDDDLWIFVNGRLAMDLGGVHEPMQGSIDFDEMATELGIVLATPPNTYSMDIFHAERQTLESNFKVQTNITCFEPVIIIK